GVQACARLEGQSCVKFSVYSPKLLRESWTARTRVIKLLMSNLSEAEQQSAMAHKAHLQSVDHLLELQKSRLAALESHGNTSLRSSETEYNTEREQFLKLHHRESEYLKAETQALKQRYGEKYTMKPDRIMKSTMTEQQQWHLEEQQKYMNATDYETNNAFDLQDAIEGNEPEQEAHAETAVRGERERFWSELDEVMESIPTGERVVIGADFNVHVGEGNTGDEEVMGKFGVKERNLEGQKVVDFAKTMDMTVVNTYFQKREEHRVTYKSGGRRTQVDYILCRRGNLKEISDCKVFVGEIVARQHRMVVCRMTLMVCKKKRSKIEIEKKTKWWKLKKEECCEEFRQKLRQVLGGQVVLPDDWETTAEVIRQTGRKVLGVSSGRRKEDKVTCWWNEEVQDSIQRKRLAKKKWDMDRTEENRQEYKELQCRVKREVSKAKQKAYDELYTRLDTREGQKDLYRLARQRDRDGKDVQQKVDKIRKDEVRKALKLMKSGKAVGPDDIPVEVWKCLGEAAVEFVTSLFNRVLENSEKAYDRVPREELWYCMRKSGVAEKYVRVVQDSVMGQLSEEVRQESPWTMMFADDIVICSESREQVEENLERWRFALERRGMKVIRSKTEYMCVNEREGSGTVRLQGEEVKKVQEFKYLGSTVQSNGECGKEGEELLRLVDVCHKLETEQEKVLAFCTSSSNAKKKEKAHALEVMSDELAQTMMDYTDLEKFWQRYNKVVLERLCLEREKKVLGSENQRLRILLKQYLDGISVREEILQQPNSLLMLSSPPLLDSPASRTKRHIRKPVVEAAFCGEVHAVNKIKSK
ncbi:hypothetical protein QTP70_022300, partial [Hemibagrus guttatus]